MEGIARNTKILFPREKILNDDLENSDALRIAFPWKGKGDHEVGDEVDRKLSK